MPSDSEDHERIRRLEARVTSLEAANAALRTLHTARQSDYAEMLTEARDVLMRLAQAGDSGSEATAGRGTRLDISALRAGLGRIQRLLQSLTRPLEEGADVGPDDEPGPSPSRPRILVAEDNSVLAGHLQRVLSRYWDVEVCEDGNAAIACVGERPPDLVLLDVMMPGLDGIEVCERLKSSPATRDIPVVIVTALGELDDRLRGFDAGADEYVIKPFSARELIARLRVLLELRQAQARLRTYTGTLESLVEEQVGHILDQNVALLRAAREMEDFLAIASHDLRSPLVSIRGFADIVSDALAGHEDATLVDAVERIRFNVAWMDELTDRLLTLATLRARGATSARVELARLFGRIRERILAQHAERSLTLEVQPDLPAVRGDPFRLEEAVANLVDNSIKYRHPDRDPVVRVTGEVEGDTLVLAFADNGVGVDPARHAEVVKPLVRLGGGVGQGAGLGLHIVQRVVEESGGRLWLSGQEGEGLTVHLQLQLAGPPGGDDAV